MRWELVICAAVIGCAPGAPETARAPSRVARLTSETLVNEIPSRVSPAQVRRVALAHDGDVRACYAVEAQGDPTLQGGLVVSWEILPEGTVSAPMLVRSTFDNPRLEACVLDQVRRWRFPASDSQTTVPSYSFRFPQ